MIMRLCQRDLSLHRSGGTIRPPKNYLEQAQYLSRSLVVPQHCEAYGEQRALMQTCIT